MYVIYLSYGLFNKNTDYLELIISNKYHLRCAIVIFDASVIRDV